MITDELTNMIYFSPALERDCPRLWESILEIHQSNDIRHNLLYNPLRINGL